VALGLGALFLVFMGAGWWGVDFGPHWDEGVIASAWKKTVVDGAYRPPFFYPAFFYDLSLPVLGWAALQAESSEALVETVGSMAFRLMVRREFVFIVSFAVPLTFFGVRRLRGRDVDGWVAAAFVATCWQLNYHGRFVVTDALVATIAPVSTWLSLEAMRRPERAGRLLAAAGAVAALATASKYPGGVALGPALWVAMRGHPPERGLRSSAQRLALVGASFVVVLLLAHPRIWLEFAVVWGEIVGQKGAYESGLLGHAIEPGLVHAGHMAVYLVHTLSPFHVLAVGLALLGLLGLFEALRLPREQAFVLLVVPAFYAVYFSTVNSMIVRNLMVLVPYMAALIGLGAGHVFDRLGTRRLRHAFAAVLVLAFGANAAHLYWAADTVRRWDRGVATAALTAEIESRPDERFLVTKYVVLAFQKYEAVPDTRNWSVVQRDDDVADEANVAVMSHEYRVLLFNWPANRIGRYHDFGPKDVDWDFYPGWGAVDRPVLMPGALYETVRTPRHPNRGRPRPGRTPAEAAPS